MPEDRNPRMSSVIGESAVVIGNVDGTGDLEVRGQVQGTIQVSGRVLIAESGVILGGVEATNITIAGEVRGDLSAKDGVEVQALGRVEGNIEAPRVGIEAGARVRGFLRTGGELPSANAQSDPPIAIKTPPEIAEPTAQPTSDRPTPKARRRRGGKKSSVTKEAATKEVATKEVAPQTAPPQKPEKGGNPQASAQNPPQESRSESRPATQKLRTKKAPRRPGPPKPPTFVKGAKGHSRG